MKTPEEFKSNLKNEVVTDEMIANVCWSYYIRSINYNRRENDYIKESSFYNLRNTFTKRKDIFNMKLMGILDLYEKNLKSIIKQKIPKVEKIFDYDKNYYNINWDDVINTGYYYDNELHRFVEFIGVKKSSHYNYYLHYEFPNDYNFYIPIDSPDEYVKTYNLEIKNADKPILFGVNVNNILTCQFCDKVYKLLFPSSND